MKNMIRGLIEAGRTKRAIEKLGELDNMIPDYDYANTITLLSSRHSRLRSNNMTGILSSDELEREQNKLDMALLSLLDEMCGELDMTDETTGTENNNDDMIESLQAIQGGYRRKNKSLSEDAGELIREIQAYENSRSTHPTFDVSGRLWKGLVEKRDGIIRREKEFRLDKLEELNGKVTGLLSEDIPTYGNLEKAYSLLLGYGYRDETVRDQLRAKVDDDDVRIEITESLEIYLRSLIAEKG